MNLDGAPPSLIRNLLRHRGKIVSAIIDLDLVFDYLLINYFSPNEKEPFYELDEWVFKNERITTDFKRLILQKIIKKHLNGDTKKKFLDIINEIEDLLKIRNNFSHCANYPVYTDSEIKDGGVKLLKYSGNLQYTWYSKHEINNYPVRVKKCATEIGKLLIFVTYHKNNE